MRFVAWTDDRGNVALFFALIAPVLLAIAGGAVDFQSLGLQRAALQEAADALATRGAREFLLENATEGQVEALVHATADAQYEQSLGAFTLAADAQAREKSVTAAITQAPHKGILLHNLAAFQRPVSVTATAVARGASNVCVIALESEGAGAVKAGSSAKLLALKCSILSNSTSSHGIEANEFSQLKAALICSAGGAQGGSANFEPQPLTDCPVFEDPLKDRLEPDVGACDHTDLVLGEAGFVGGVLGHALTTAVSLLDGSDEDTLIGYTRYDLTPGVYCGGVKIRGDADVHLEPGVYVFKNGPLVIDLGGRLFGKSVGLYFSGDGAIFTFEPESIVHLTAPTDGVMAGMLMLENRARASTETYSILSSNARTLLGTIYLPMGRLHVDSLMPIADASAYTAIVSRYLNMSGSPQLVLNANYALTDVPVPDGIGPTGGQVFLRE
jgi:Flp pilus assembly protein TadG